MAENTSTWRARLARIPPSVFAGAAVIAAAAIAYGWLTSRQSIRVLFDSAAYLEPASQSWSWSQLFYPKPPVIPLVYRWVGTDPIDIVWFQEWFGFVAWAVLGVVLVSALRSRRARIAATLVTLAFAFAPLRLGYADALLSESINDSLMALSLAAAIALLVVPERIADERRRRWARVALQVVLVAVLAAWMFTRDTNAVVALCGVAIANVYGGRPRRAHIGRLVASGVVAAVAIFVMWSTSVIPPPTRLSVHDGWQRDLTARGTFSTLNSIVDRVFPDPEARAFFADHGLVAVEDLARIQDRNEIIKDPRYAESQRWIAEHGRGVYIRWLATHPLERLEDQVTYFWSLLGVHAEQTYSMPTRMWVGRRSLLRRVLPVTTSKPVILVLLVVFPVVVWRMRRDSLARFALGCVLAGWIGSIAAFYADTSEPTRHCYGSGQQVIFGLFLVVLVWFDARSRAAPR
ncbi:MAG: hypothetical protein HOV81_29740 [Kofleriaceae bacterium]|nr:hypothetical protein [Kofleriaceae bacterium]